MLPVKDAEGDQEGVFHLVQAISGEGAAQGASFQEDGPQFPLTWACARAGKINLATPGKLPRHYSIPPALGRASDELCPLPVLPLLCWCKGAVVSLHFPFDLPPPLFL